MQIYLEQKFQKLMDRVFNFGFLMSAENNTQISSYNDVPWAKIF